MRKTFLLFALLTTPVWGQTCPEWLVSLVGLPDAGKVTEKAAAVLEPAGWLDPVELVLGLKVGTPPADSVVPTPFWRSRNLTLILNQLRPANVTIVDEGDKLLRWPTVWVTVRISKAILLGAVLRRDDVTEVSAPGERDLP